MCAHVQYRNADDFRSQYDGMRFSWRQVRPTVSRDRLSVAVSSRESVCHESTPELSTPRPPYHPLRPRPTISRLQTECDVQPVEVSATTIFQRNAAAASPPRPGDLPTPAVPANSDGDSDRGLH